VGRESITKPGLTLDDHRALADELRAVRGYLLGVRDTLKTTIGSATVAYQSAGRVLNGLANLENALTHEAVGEYVDEIGIAALRTLYGPESSKENI
jgi:hypothetical protein